MVVLLFVAVAAQVGGGGQKDGSVGRSLSAWVRGRVRVVVLDVNNDEVTTLLKVVWCMDGGGHDVSEVDIVTDR